MRIGILQPLIPHYREEFFKGLNKAFDIDLYIYQKQKDIEKDKFENSMLGSKYLNSFHFSSIFIYNFIPLLNLKYKVLILPGEIRSISTWLLLLIGKLSSIKIILWGHGISNERYLKEEKKLLSIRILFHKLADHIWLYTEKEKEIWSKYIDKEKITALNNTIDIKTILNLSKLDKESMKKKYQINTKLNLIYCARFTANRRIDLMLRLIQELEDQDIGFIIIGEGEYKPDFSSYKNVYDFGSIYDLKKKNELFCMSDLYFQPAWIGLSIVEAMAFGKPVLTLERSQDIMHGVEYSYLRHGINGFIGKDLDDVIFFIKNISKNELEELQGKTRIFAKRYLNIENMINNAEVSLKRLNK